VVRAEGWRRADLLDATGIPWVNPSPNLRSVDEALLYPGVSLVEATNVSVGRGTPHPFEQVGAPWIDGERLAAALADRLNGWRFTEPSGGLSVWVSLGDVDGERFAQTALRHGVAVATATALSVSDRHADRIRVSFASPPAVLREGVERLGAAWEAIRS